MVPSASTSSRLLDQLNQATDVSVLSNQILHWIKERIPLDSALILLGNPVQVFNPNGFPIEPLNELRARFSDHPEMLEDFTNRPRHSHRPVSFKDGTAIFLLPFVNAGVLESVLSFYVRDNADQDLLIPQLKSLYPICSVGAEAMARIRKRESGSAELGNTDTGLGSLTPLSFVASRLTGTIAHDLRSPITAIRGYLKMFLNGRIGPVTEVQQECLEGAMNCINQLAKIAGMVGGTSSFIEQIHPEVMNFNDLWRIAWISVQNQAQEKSIALKERLATQRPMICVDQRILSDVIAKLMSHAIALADSGTEMYVDLLSRKTDDVILKITFTCRSAERDMQEVVSGLHSSVFLHGGKLTTSTSIEGESSFTLLLPECVS